MISICARESLIDAPKSYGIVAQKSIVCDREKEIKRRSGVEGRRNIKRGVVQMSMRGVRTCECESRADLDSKVLYKTLKYRRKTTDLPNGTVHRILKHAISESCLDMTWFAR